MRVTGSVFLDNCIIVGPGSIVWNTDENLGSYDVGGNGAGIAASFFVNASGPTTVAYSLTSGVLPPLLSLNANTGEISGTGHAILPTVDYNFEITATSGLLTSAKNFKITALNSAGGDLGN